MECKNCDGDGLIDFSDEEWIEMYGVPLAEYTFTGKEEQTLKRCPECDGLGVKLDKEGLLTPPVNLALEDMKRKQANFARKLNALSQAELYSVGQKLSDAYGLICEKMRGSTFRSYRQEHFNEVADHLRMLLKITAGLSQYYTEIGTLFSADYSDEWRKEQSK